MRMPLRYCLSNSVGVNISQLLAYATPLRRTTISTNRCSPSSKTRCRALAQAADQGRGLPVPAGPKISKRLSREGGKSRLVLIENGLILSPIL